MKKLFIFSLMLVLFASCATLAPSIKAVEKELAVHTVFFTVLEDCEAGSEVCKYSAISIIDKIGIVDNMKLNGFSKIGIKQTEKTGVWEFVTSSEEADRTVDINHISPHRSIKSTQ